MTVAICSTRCNPLDEKVGETMTPQPRRTDDDQSNPREDQGGRAGSGLRGDGGVGMFAMTVWLVIKDGAQAGQHLQLLSNYFVGYSVTWPGAFVGLLYGAVTGGFIGWVIGRIYNGVVSIRKQ